MIRVYAQVEYKEIPTEIKTNGLYFAIGYYNISTECLINKNWSLVLSIYIRKNENLYNDIKSIYSINSRYYFGKALARSALFVEGSFLLYKLKSDYYYQLVKKNPLYKVISSSIGYKKFIIGNLYTEAFISGVIFSFGNNTRLENVPIHAGLSLGYRF